VERICIQFVNITYPTTRTKGYYTERYERSTKEKAIIYN